MISTYRRHHGIVALLVFVFFLAIFFIGVKPNRSRAATNLAACEQVVGNQTISGTAYSNGWLLCASSDTYSGSVQILKETSVGSGSFTFVEGTGGWFLPDSMTQYGVPIATANILVPALAYSMQSRSSGSNPRAPGP